MHYDGKSRILNQVAHLFIDYKFMLDSFSNAA